MASCPPFLHPTTAEHDDQAQNGLTSTIPPTHHPCKARPQAQSGPMSTIHSSFNPQPSQSKTTDSDVRVAQCPSFLQLTTLALQSNTIMALGSESECVPKSTILSTHNPCTSCRAKPLYIRLRVCPPFLQVQPTTLAEQDHQAQLGPKVKSCVNSKNQHRNQ